MENKKKYDIIIKTEKITEKDEDKDMTQKTLKRYVPYYDEDYCVKVGEKVMLVEKYDELKQESWWKIVRNADNGIGGNMDSSEKRYHGWRGTTNNTATYAHGLRKVIKASGLIEDSNGEWYQKVTVGKDLTEDEE